MVYNPEALLSYLGIFLSELQHCFCYNSHLPPVSVNKILLDSQGLSVTAIARGAATEPFWPKPQMFPIRKSVPTGVFHQIFLKKNTELKEYINYKGIYIGMLLHFYTYITFLHRYTYIYSIVLIHSFTQQYILKRVFHTLLPFTAA